jgi:hypothetical protein
MSTYLEKYAAFGTGLFIGAYLNYVTDSINKDRTTKVPESILKHHLALILFYDGSLTLPYGNFNIRKVFEIDKTWNIDKVIMYWIFPAQRKYNAQGPELTDLVRSMFLINSYLLTKYCRIIVSFLLDHGVMVHSLIQESQEIRYKYSKTMLSNMIYSDLIKLTRVFKSMVSFGFVYVVAQISYLIIESLQDNIINDEFSKCFHDWAVLVTDDSPDHRASLLQSIYRKTTILDETVIGTLIIRSHEVHPNKKSQLRQTKVFNYTDTKENMNKVPPSNQSVHELEV